MSSMRPELVLFTANGERFLPLEEWTGNPTLVLFYHTDCLGCTGRALPLAYRLSNAYPLLKLAVVHVDFPSRPIPEAEVQAVFTDGKAPFPIYHDQAATMYTQFQAEGTPQWLLFDASGALVNTIFGSQDNAQNRLSYALEELFPTESAEVN